VSVVADGTEAVAALASTTFHAVVSDFSMPGTNGLEVLQLARKLLPDARLVLISGALTDDLRTAGAHLGAEVIEKPFQPGTLTRLAGMCGCDASPVA